MLEPHMESLLGAQGFWWYSRTRHSAFSQGLIPHGSNYMGSTTFWKYERKIQEINNSNILHFTLFWVVRRNFRPSCSPTVPPVARWAIIEIQCLCSCGLRVQGSDPGNVSMNKRRQRPSLEWKRRNSQTEKETQKSYAEVAKIYNTIFWETS